MSNKTTAVDRPDPAGDVFAVMSPFAPQPKQEGKCVKKYAMMGSAILLVCCLLAACAADSGGKPAPDGPQRSSAAQPGRQDSFPPAEGIAQGTDRPESADDAGPSLPQPADGTNGTGGNDEELPAPGKPAATKPAADIPSATAAQSTYHLSSSGESPDDSRKPLSWYYMKKKKGEVPGFPGDTKRFKETDKVLWVGTGKKVYLTLDNGGPMGDTDKLLKALRDNDVKANFFIAGYNMKAHPDFVRTLAEEGHLIANHSMSHKDFTEMTDEQIRKEITDYEELYKEITGKDIEKFFRFPYGRYNLHILSLVSQMGYTSVFWSTAMRDWEPRENGADDPYNDIMNNLHDGNIILMHQGSKENIEALDRIIKSVKEAGYEFALLTDIQPPERK